MNKPKTTAATPGTPSADQADTPAGVGTVFDKDGPKATGEQTKPGANIKDNAPDGLALSDSEAKEARKEGAKEAAQEAAKNAYTYLTDGNLPGDPPVTPYLGSDDIMQFAHLLEQGPDQFKATVAEDAEPPLPEEKVAGLYKLERNGQNRTPYVKALRDRLGLKKGEDVPGAGGPPWTNDISLTSEL